MRAAHGSMIAEKVRIAERESGYTFSADIRSARAGAFRLEHDVRGGRREWLSETGDPLVAALLVPAMATGETLILEAPVSLGLRQNTARLQDIYHAWRPDLARVDIVAPDGAPPATGRDTGLFFGCGVDSFFSLLKDSSRDGGSPSIAHLVLADGFDIRPGNPGLFEKVARSAQHVARAAEKHLVVVGTNLRTFTDRLVGWDIYHGAALASLGLTLGGLLRRCLIPSTHAYAELVPWGSHPLLDPLWSTETVDFVHDGCEASRTDKIRRLASWALALRHLRVCWLDWTDDYNCGRCEKCIRTMIALHIAGALGRAATFPLTLDTAHVRRMNLITGESSLRFLDDLLGALHDSAEDRRIAGALRHVIRRTRLRAQLGSLIPGRLRRVVAWARPRRGLAHPAAVGRPASAAAPAGAERSDRQA
jgi:hypothetical protein